MFKQRIILLFILILGLSSAFPQAGRVYHNEKIDLAVEFGFLTWENREWLDQLDTIRIGLLLGSSGDDVSSFFGLAGDEEKRFLSEFLVKLFSYLDIEVSFEYYGTIREIEEGFTAGEVDVLFGVPITRDNSSLMAFTHPLMSNPIAILSRSSAHYAGSLEELSGNDVAVMGGSGAEAILRTEYPDIYLHPYENYRRPVEALADGTIDAFVGDLSLITSAMQKFDVQGLNLSGTTEYYEEYCIGVRSDWPEMMPILNSLIAIMPREDRVALLSRFSSIILEDWINWSQVIGIGSLSIVVLLGFFLYALAWNKKLKKEVILKERIHQDLMAANRELESSNEAKGQFLANMSHEIRTPMNAILGLTHLVLKTDLNEKQKEYVQKISYSADNLLGIINDILDFSKIDAGKLSLDEVPFNLNDVIDNLAHLFSQTAEEKGINMSVDIDKEVPAILKGDPLRLGQILINLTGNALKFTQTGYVKARVTLESKEGKRRLLKFSVKDSGIGLTEEQRQSLFTPFTQADGSTSRRFGGTGLGLAICRELTEMMGGTIGVDSVYGRGSDFHFTAWFEVANGEELVSGASPGGAEELLRFPGSRILLVEDNKINQEVAVDILHEAEIEVDLAENGRIAVELLQDMPNRYDLVLMDILMPEMDGYTAVREIRKRLGLANLPIIAMTASAMAGDREKSLEAGMNDYVMKPIETGHFFRTLSKYLTGVPVGEGAAAGFALASQEIEFALPEKLPGIDSERGLSRVGNKRSLYIRMLRRFVEEEIPRMEQLNQALANRDRDEAERLAHTLKSTAATIGADEIAKEAERIERMIRHHPHKCHMMNLSALREKMDMVLTGLRMMIPMGEVVPCCADREERCIETLETYLMALLPHLQKKKPMQSKEIVKEMERFHYGSEYDGRIAELNPLLKKYKFQEALGLVQSLLEEIGEGGKG